MDSLNRTFEEVTTVEDSASQPELTRIGHAIRDRDGDVTGLKLLLHHKADADVKNEEALLAAIRQGEVEVLDVLPFTKITKEEPKWRDRRMKTTRLLTPYTDRNWKSKSQKTSLPIALDQGIDSQVTTELSGDRGKSTHERYLIKDSRKATAACHRSWLNYGRRSWRRRQKHGQRKCMGLVPKA
ncbi:uncharacterized protein PG986_000790 [Apiospora aurea]|uniref:Ankyrin repeat protein n=1 Tax=Apiospora aurea TaxID=335848 RepID=A0ABR1QVP4_9PEZI